MADRSALATKTPPTMDEILTWPPTISVPLACTVLGISSSTGYDLVARNAFPTRCISVGSRHRVVTASLVQLLSCEQGEVA